MASMSDYLENKLIDAIFRNVSFTPPTPIYFALYTAAPSFGVAAFTFTLA